MVDLLSFGYSTEAKAAVSSPSLASSVTTATPDTDFPCCGAGKRCPMPDKKLNAGCYDRNGKPKHRCRKCGDLLHGGICGSGEGKELTCFICVADLEK
jgi:hypothetical protein